MEVTFTENKLGRTDFWRKSQEFNLAKITLKISLEIQEVIPCRQSVSSHRRGSELEIEI